MPKYPNTIQSKLPKVGTTIFSVMSQLAAEHNAINLSQGFPDFESSEELTGLVSDAMKKGLNQYAPMPGVPLLRKNIAKLIKEKYYNWFLPAIKTGFKNTLNALWDLKTSLLILPIISALAYLWQWFMTVKYPNDFQLNIPSQLDFLIVGVLKFVVIYIIFKVFLIFKIIKNILTKYNKNSIIAWSDIIKNTI